MSREPTHPATNRTMTLTSTTTLVDTTAANPYNVGAILPVEAFCEPDRLSPTRAIVLYDFDRTDYNMHPSSTGVEYLRPLKGEPVYMSYAPDLDEGWVHVSKLDPKTQAPLVRGWVPSAFIECA